MTDPKPSTNDIMSKIRAKNAAAASATEPPAESTPGPPPTDAPNVAADAAVTPKSAAAPTGTASILAAIKKPAVAPAATPGASSPAPAAGAAKSPADIMAAIRAKAGAAPAAAAATGPVASTPVVKAEVKTVTPGMSPADMIKAIRSSSEGVPGPPKVVLPAKPLAAKAPASKVATPEVARRSFLEDIFAVLLSPVFIAWSAFVGSLTASGLAVARFMMPNVLVEPPTKFKIGPPNDYSPGTVSTKWQAQFNVWIVNGEVDGAQMIYALSTVCTHLGCTPNWLEGEQKFKCPCHGSGFYKNGVNFEGPAPRPLERVGLRLAEDGMLEVDKSVKFQKELGQWANPSSYVGVT